jgi:hypothetical protein
VETFYLKFNSFYREKMAFFTRRGNASVPELPTIANGGNSNAKDDDRDGVEV